jgi:hypothetical protein
VNDRESVDGEQVERSRKVGDGGRKGFSVDICSVRACRSLSEVVGGEYRCFRAAGACIQVYEAKKIEEGTNKNIFQRQDSTDRFRRLAINTILSQDPVQSFWRPPALQGGFFGQG